MSETVQTAMFEILKSIQAQLAAHDRRFDALEARFDVLETRSGEVADLVRRQRRDTAGLLVMAKSVTGDFAEQIAAIEDRVAALEARCS
jgi:3-dehydroquinate dehydratase